MKRKIHFLYKDYAEDCVELAQKFIDAFGQASVDEAEFFVTIGGDGLALHAMSIASGRPVFPVTPEGSNSAGFFADHDIKTAQDLINKITRAHQYIVNPLKATLHYKNGESSIIRAFNEVSFMRIQGQGALAFVGKPGMEKQDFNRVMCDGLTFSTPMGSTGANRSYGGPLVDIANPSIIFTSQGSYPDYIAPQIFNQDTKFRINFGNADRKRPIRVDYDGQSIHHHVKEYLFGLIKIKSPIMAMDLEMDQCHLGVIALTSTHPQRIAKIGEPTRRKLAI